MNIYHEFPNLQEPVAIALGYFDGVHLGHRAVIDAAVNYAQNQNMASAVFTFELDAEHVASRGGDILSLNQRQKRIEALGVNHYICPSASSFYGKTGEWFVEEMLVQKLQVKAVFCGKDFTFGKSRAANVQYLKQLCAKHNIEVIVLDSVEFEGKAVSSTRIRKALQQGDIELVNQLLGVPYTIDFEVVHGKQLGRTIGCPTMNQLYPPQLLSPLYGVYITSVNIGGHQYAGATGFGTRPTVNGDYASAETYIQGFQGDLYGKNIETTFYKYLYPQMKFESLEELATLIHKAANTAEAFFNSR